MAMSGVKLDDACKTKYEEVQKKHLHRYVTFHIKDDKEIVVDKVLLFPTLTYLIANPRIGSQLTQSLFIQVGARDATFNEFIDAVKQKDGSSEDCRYAILDYEFTLEAQGTEASQRYVLLQRFSD